MARVVLINPSVEFEKMGRYKDFFFAMPSIAMAYLGGMLETREHQVKIIDMAAEPTDVKSVLDIIGKNKTEFVGISCLTPTAQCSFEIAKAIRKSFPEIYIIWGNVHSSYYANEIITGNLADVVVHGEGEYTLTDVVECITKKEDLKHLKGISFRNNGGVFNTGVPEPIENLDNLSYPAWHLLPIEKYKMMVIGGPNLATIGLMASRGCPNACHYCSSAFQNRGFRKRNPSQIIEELTFMRAKYKTKQFIFMDPIFPLEKNHAMEVFNGIIKQGLHKEMRWASETHPDFLDGELLKKMKEAGCHLLYLGVETANAGFLNSFGRKIDLRHAEQVIKLASRLGILCFGLFMIGLPGETRSSVNDTTNLAKKLGLEFSKFSIYIPLPGSQLFEVLLKEGQIKNLEWEHYNFHPGNQAEIIYHPKDISPLELIKLQKKCYLEFYLRAHLIFNNLLRLRYFSFGQLINVLQALFGT